MLRKQLTKHVAVKGTTTTHLPDLRRTSHFYASTRDQNIASIATAARTTHEQSADAFLPTPRTIFTQLQKDHHISLAHREFTKTAVGLLATLDAHIRFTGAVSLAAKIRNVCHELFAIAANICSSYPLYYALKSTTLCAILAD
jgi:hypothetical protein